MRFRRGPDRVAALKRGHGATQFLIDLVRIAELELDRGCRLEGSRGGESSRRRRRRHQHQERTEEGLCTHGRGWWQEPCHEIPTRVVFSIHAIHPKKVSLAQ